MSARISQLHQRLARLERNAGALDVFFEHIEACQELEIKLEELLKSLRAQPLPEDRTQRKDMKRKIDLLDNFRQQVETKIERIRAGLPQYRKLVESMDGFIHTSIQNGYQSTWKDLLGDLKKDPSLKGAAQEVDKAVPAVLKDYLPL